MSKIREFPLTNIEDVSRAVKEIRTALERLGSENMGKYAIDSSKSINTVRNEWTPVLTGSGGMVLSNIVVAYAYYYIVGKLVFINTRCTLTVAAPLGSNITLTLPVSCADLGYNGGAFIAPCIIFTAGTKQLGVAYPLTRFDKMYVERIPTINYTAGNVILDIQLFYEGDF